MRETTLLRASIVITFLGLSALIILSLQTTLPQRAVLQEDDYALISGSINRITQLEKVTFLDVHTDGDISVVLFKEYPVDLHKGDFIEARGKTQKGNDGELQFIAKEVRVIK